jgi:hypothetical protein
MCAICWLASRVQPVCAAEAARLFQVKLREGLGAQGKAE